MNNEFGKDMNDGPSKSKNGRKERDGKSNGPSSKFSSFATGWNRQQEKTQNQTSIREVCSGQHRIWKCEKFKGIA